MKRIAADGHSPQLVLINLEGAFGTSAGPKHRSTVSANVEPCSEPKQNQTKASPTRPSIFHQIFIHRASFLLPFAINE
jgi:hypothetical protein